MSLFKNNIHSIYNNYHPAFNNLFEIRIYNTGQNNDADTSLNDYISLHAIKVSFGDETLNLMRDNITKKFRIKDNYAYVRSDILKITYRENDAFMIKKYHESWMKSIYSSKTDSYKSRTMPYSKKEPDYPAKGVYRNIDVIMGPSDRKQCIRFKNVILKNIPGIDLAWSSTGQIIQPVIQYYVESWSWEKVK